MDSMRGYDVTFGFLLSLVDFIFEFYFALMRCLSRQKFDWRRTLHTCEGDWRRVERGRGLVAGTVGSMSWERRIQMFSGGGLDENGDRPLTGCKRWFCKTGRFGLVLTAVGDGRFSGD